MNKNIDENTIKLVENDDKNAVKMSKNIDENAVGEFIRCFIKILLHFYNYFAFLTCLQHGFSGDFTALCKGGVEDVLRRFTTVVLHGFFRFFEGGAVDGHDGLFRRQPYAAVERETMLFTPCERGFGP